jgi:hypothetical protein
VRGQAAGREAIGRIVEPGAAQAPVPQSTLPPAPVADALQPLDHNTRDRTDTATTTGPRRNAHFIVPSSRGADPAASTVPTTNDQAHCYLGLARGHVNGWAR